MHASSFRVFSAGLALACLGVLAASAATIDLVVTPGTPFQEEGAETIDITAAGAPDRATFGRGPGFGVVRNWLGFEGKGSAESFSNYGLLPDGATLRGRLVLKTANDFAPWAGRAMDRREHWQKALNSCGYSAIILPGSGHVRHYELSFGTGVEGDFKADRVVRALAFVVTNIQDGETVWAEFYDAAGELLAQQNASGQDVEDSVVGYQGKEIFFGWIASAEPRKQIQRVTIRLQASNQYKDWAVDAVGFTPPAPLAP